MDDERDEVKKYLWEKLLLFSCCQFKFKKKKRVQSFILKFDLIFI